jgi:membrane-bound lytic murein transglycosylase B
METHIHKDENAIERARKKKEGRTEGWEILRKEVRNKRRKQGRKIWKEMSKVFFSFDF